MIEYEPTNFRQKGKSKESTEMLNQRRIEHFELCQMIIAHSQLRTEIFNRKGSIGFGVDNMMWI